MINQDTTIIFTIDNAFVEYGDIIIDFSTKEIVPDINEATIYPAKECPIGDATSITILFSACQYEMPTEIYHNDRLQLNRSGLIIGRGDCTLDTDI